MGRVDSVYWTLAGEEPYLRTVYLYDEEKIKEALEIWKNRNAPTLLREDQSLRTSLYTVGKAICIDGLGSDETVRVYDLDGSLVGCVTGDHVRIPVATFGVYVVMSGKTSVRVLVK